MFEPDHTVQEDGIVGAWHRWVIISVASTVLFSYVVYILLRFVMDHTGLGSALGLTIHGEPMDWRLLLLAIPFGILRGERGYQRDVKTNGSRMLTESGKTPVASESRKGDLI